MRFLKGWSAKNRIFLLIIVVTFVGMPIVLLASAGGEYEGLELREARVTTTTADGETTARMGLLIDNDGDREVRVTSIAALIDDSSGRVVRDLTVRVNTASERRRAVSRIDQFEIEVQRRRYVELSRELEPCDGSDEPDRVEKLLVGYDIFSSSQEREIELPTPVTLPGCAGGAGQ